MSREHRRAGRPAQSRQSEGRGQKRHSSDAAQGAVSNVGEQARRTGSRLVDVIRENPLPVIAVGAGVTWLLTTAVQQRGLGEPDGAVRLHRPERRQGDSWQHGTGITGRVGDAVSGVKEKVSEAASGIAERASELASGTQERIGRYRLVRRVGRRERRQDQSGACRRRRTRLRWRSARPSLGLALGYSCLAPSGRTR